MTNSNLYILSFKTKFGRVELHEENNNILSIYFSKSTKQNPSIILKKLKEDIKQYFKGNEIFINKYNIKLEGSFLQKKILKEISKIPYGKTTTYGQIAKKFKTSPRYVGNVCGKNKHLLIIPCHRVVRSDGQLGGYSGYGGIKLKKKLIELEKTLINIS